MNLQQVKNYNYWVGKTPWELLEAVKGIGGWKVVFPNELPLWAHRIRNFFNREPAVLKRLDENRAKPHLDNIESGYPKDSSLIEEFKERHALTGDVYKDLNGYIWFQMRKSATIYHWGNDPIVPIIEAPKQEFELITPPVFKLISVDGTGGSRETIIRNPFPLIGFYNVLREENVDVEVADRVVTNTWHQGSYNYSETSVSGISDHEKRDVETHKKFKMNNVYVNPFDRFASLRFRRFPFCAPNEVTPLAVQKTVRDIPNIVSTPSKYSFKKINRV